MKTLDQIIRYTSDCRFPQEDWEKIKAFCHNYENGGYIRKSKDPIVDSTYEKFIDWLDNGLGSGDMISYGNTMGVIGDSIPGKTYLAAYCDYEGNLIVKEMDVIEPKRLKHLDPDRCRELKKKIFEKGLDYIVETATFVKLCTPKEKLYYVYGESKKGLNNIGMYLESVDNKYHFAAYVENGKIILDKWIDIDYTPLRPASEKEILRFHKALEKAKIVFNQRLCQFIKAPERGKNNTYWYLNDRFEIVADRDDGGKRHTERFKVKNYFLDYTESLLFMSEVHKLRKEE